MSIEVQYLELLGSVRNILTSNPSAKFVIAGDFNYNIFDSSQSMSEVLREFLNNFDLITTHSLDSTFNDNSSYTRSCDKRGDLSNFLKYTNSKNLKYTNSKTQTELQQDKIC